MLSHLQNIEINSELIVHFSMIQDISIMSSALTTSNFLKCEQTSLKTSQYYKTSLK